MFLVLAFVLPGDDDAILRPVDDLLLVFELVRIQSADLVRLSRFVAGGGTSRATTCRIGSCHF